MVKSGWPFPVDFNYKNSRLNYTKVSWKHNSMRISVKNFALQTIFLNFFNILILPVESIKIDLPRTFPDNIFFNNIKLQLFNVLIAYAHHNKDVGYCQGLNYIAGKFRTECKRFFFVAQIHKIKKFFSLHALLHRFNSNCHQRRGMDILVAENNCWRYRFFVPYKNDDWPYHRYWSSTGTVKQTCTTNKSTFGSLRSAIGCNNNEMVNLFICRSAANWNCFTHLGLSISGRIQGLWIIFVVCIWFWNSSLEKRSLFQILFRVSLTLLLSQKDAILQTEDISGLANLLRDLCKGPMVTNCHQFINSIFTVPGTLKRSEIEILRRNVVLDKRWSMEGGIFF